MKYTVQIKQYSDDEVIKEFKPCSSERQAEKLERGVNINLNHEDYYTIIKEEDDTTSPKPIPDRRHDYYVAAGYCSPL